MASADGHVEIELKFQVPAHRRPALEKALATTTAQHIDLRARYFDTPDGRLAAAQLALRLRREGDRWVQTLKGRGDGLMHRLEDEVPRAAADGDPPPLDLSLHAGTHAARALAETLAGAAPPEVRYGTEIRRIRRVLRHAGAQVEVALDMGDIVAGASGGGGGERGGAEARIALCEVEFELVSGPEQGLLDLAASWARRFGLLVDPATKSERAQWLAQALAQRPVTRAHATSLPADTPLGEARAAMVAAALAHALPNAAAITSGAFGPEHVHQLRVALRRLRTVLRAFGPPDAARDEALAALFAALGGTRDADVLALTLAPAWQAAQAAGLLPPSADRVEVADEPGPAALRQPSTTHLWLALIALTVPAPGGAPWARPALKRLRRWHRVAAVDAGQWQALDDAARHRLRKRLKRLRYLLEFSLPLLPKQPAAREAKALRRLQEALGQWNDQVVAQAWLATLDPADPARRFAEGWLARDAGLVEQVCRDAAREWRRLKGEALTPRRRQRR